MNSCCYFQTEVEKCYLQEILQSILKHIVPEDQLASSVPPKHYSEFQHPSKFALELEILFIFGGPVYHWFNTPGNRAQAVKSCKSSSSSGWSAMDTGRSPSLYQQLQGVTYPPPAGGKEVDDWVGVGAHIQFGPYCSKDSSQQTFGPWSEEAASERSSRCTGR